MEDFQFINNYIGWSRGPELHVLDKACDTYAFSFSQFVNGEWAVVHSKFDLKCFHFFKSNYRFRTKWKIKVWKWDNGLKQVLESTYNEKHKNICLIFNHDDYEAHKSWFLKSIKLSFDNQFNLIVVSKFFDRLKSDFKFYPIQILDTINDIPAFEEKNSIYATYIIDRHELLLNGGWDWHSNKIFLNHTNPCTSWDHPDDWLGKNYDQIYNNIMGI